MSFAESNFFPFQNLVIENKKLQENILNYELKQSDPKKFLNFQLRYNETQKNFYNNTMDEFQSTTYNFLLNNYQKNQTKMKKMDQKTKILPTIDKPLKVHNFIPSMVSIGSFTDEPFADTKIKSQSSIKKEAVSVLSRPKAKIYAYIPETTSWKPSSREGGIFIKVKIRNSMYGMLFSGLSHSLHEDLNFFDFNKYNWIKVSYKGENVAFYGRYGHSMCLYKNCCVMFGGSLLYSNITKSMECLNDVVVINPEKKHFKNVKCFGESVEGRRNHIAEIVGNFMIVHGGQNSKGQYLSDVAILNLGTNCDCKNFIYKFIKTETFKWMIGMVDDSNEYLGIAYHASCYYSKNEKKYTNIYKEDSLKKTLAVAENETIKKFLNKKLENEGIFIFGGRNEEGTILASLRILKLGVQPLEWIYPSCEGREPAPRYSHTMTFIKSLNSLFIYGGRNDFQQSSFLCDGFMLNPMNMNWIQCKMFGEKNLEPRASHCAVSNGSCIYIFGGMHSKGYSSSDILIFEFDQVKFNERIKEDKLKMENDIKKNLPQHKLDMATKSNLNSDTFIDLKKIKDHEFDDKNIKITNNDVMTPFKADSPSEFISFKPAPILETDMTESQKKRKLHIMRSTSKIL